MRGGISLAARLPQTESIFTARGQRESTKPATRHPGASLAASKRMWRTGLALGADAFHSAAEYASAGTARQSGPVVTWSGWWAAKLKSAAKANPGRPSE